MNIILIVILFPFFSFPYFFVITILILIAIAITIAIGNKHDFHVCSRKFDNFLILSQVQFDANTLICS